MGGGGASSSSTLDAANFISADDLCATGFFCKGKLIVLGMCFCDIFMPCLPFVIINDGVDDYDNITFVPCFSFIFCISFSWCTFLSYHQVVVAKSIGLIACVPAMLLVHGIPMPLVLSYIPNKRSTLL